MIEIFVDLDDVLSVEQMTEIAENINKLLANGWSKFGNNGTMLLFKDIKKEEAEEELERLEVTNLIFEETNYSFF